MKTLIEDLKKVITSDIEDKNKYCEMLINGFLRERESEQLLIQQVSGSATDFEIDLFKLINGYCKQGLKKPDLVKKIEWVLGNCKMS